MKQFFARLTLAVMLALAATVLIGAPAQATGRITATAAAIAFTVPWPLVVGLLVSTVLPLIVGLVTKTVTSPSVKALLLAALAAATGLLSELGAAIAVDRTYDLGIGLLTALGAFLVAVGLHFGLFKPTGVATAAQRIGDRGNS